MIDVRDERAVPSPKVGVVSKQGSIRVGFRCGLVGGLAMLGFLAFCAGAMGLGWLHPLQAIGATIGATGSAAIASGVVLHAGVSVGFGIPFAALLPDDFAPGSAAVIGGAYGIFAAAVMTGLVVPAVSPEFRTAIQPAGGAWTIGHVVFGATLALALVLRQRASVRASVHAASSDAGDSMPRPI